MNSQKIINLLTICRKSGRMTTGFDVSLNAIKDGLSKCILIASNTSPKTVKELNFQLQKNGFSDIKILNLPITIEQIDTYIGVYAGVMAICDVGFSKSFEKLILE